MLACVTSLLGIGGLNSLFLLLIGTQAHHRTFNATPVQIASVVVPLVCLAVATWAVTFALKNPQQDLAVRSRVFATMAVTSAVLSVVTFVASVPWFQTVLQL